MYPKAILAIVASAAGALAIALGMGATDFEDIDAKSWVGAAVLVLGSGGFVWLTQNGPAAPAIKAVVAFLTGGLGSVYLALDDDVLTRAEQLTALAAAVAATGLVFQFAGPKDPADGGAI